MLYYSLITSHLAWDFFVLIKMKVVLTVKYRPVYHRLGFSLLFRSAICCTVLLARNF